MPNISVENFFKNLSVLPILSAFTYAFTYVYLVGQSVYFLYPSSFIDVNINIMLEVLFKLLLLCWPLFFVVYLKMVFRRRYYFFTFLFGFFYSTIFLADNIFHLKDLVYFKGLLDGTKAVFLVAVLNISFAFSLIFLILNASSELSGGMTFLRMAATCMCLLYISFLAGFLSGSNLERIYAVKGEPSSGKYPYILISKNSYGYVLGKCDNEGDGKTFYITPYDNKTVFKVVMDDPEIKNYRSCFDDKWVFTFLDKKPSQSLCYPAQPR